MEPVLILLLAVVVFTAWGAMPRPDVRRVPAEDDGRAREDGPTIYLTDHRDDARRPLRRVLSIVAAVATVVGAIVAIVVGADL